MEEQTLTSLRRRREKAKAALAQVTDEAKTAARAGAEAGIAEARLSELLGVDRMTIRSWLGKKR